MSMMLTPNDVAHIHRRCVEYGTMTPRELSVYIAGLADGKSIKSDEVQPQITKLELMLSGAGTGYAEEL